MDKDKPYSLPFPSGPRVLFWLQGLAQDTSPNFSRQLDAFWCRKERDKRQSYLWVCPGTWV